MNTCDVLAVDLRQDDQVVNLGTVSSVVIDTARVTVELAKNGTRVMFDTYATVTILPRVVELTFEEIPNIGTIISRDGEFVATFADHVLALAFIQSQKGY